MSCQNFLKNLTAEEKQNFLDSFDLVFCDCDGWFIFLKEFKMFVYNLIKNLLLKVLFGKIFMMKYLVHRML